MRYLQISITLCTTLAHPKKYSIEIFQDKIAKVINDCEDDAESIFLKNSSFV